MSKDNIRAFPKSDDNYQNGMELRDYFAAKAMQAYLSNPAVFEAEKTSENKYNSTDETCWIADAAYEYADAMLKARLE